MTADYKGLLIKHYKLLIDQWGFRYDYPKSHWRGCGRAGKTSALMPSETPAEWISCNTCLIRRGYIRIVHCDPRVEGWPYDDRQCVLCEQGQDHETWLRVKGVGEGVEKALRHLDPEAEHPVTWADIGLVPFKDSPDPEFEDKAALDDYCVKLLREYPNECAYLEQNPNISN